MIDQHERSLNPVYGHLYSWCPVTPGDVWEVAGHRVLCADFREAIGYGYLRELMGELPACTDLICRPPGTKGSVHQALRKAGLGIRTVNHDDWMWRLLEIAEVGATDRRVFYVRNARLRSRLSKWAERKGWPVVDAGRGAMLVGVQRTVPEGWSRPDSLFDPCIGDAKEYRRFVQEGTTVRGIEIIPRKCALTLYNLWRWTGGGAKPQRVA